MPIGPRDVPSVLPLFGWIGIAGLAVLVVADLVLVWTPARGLDIFRAAEGKSDARLVTGTFLGVFSIPFVLCGVAFIAGGLAGAGGWLAWPPIFLAGFAYVVGAAFHAAIGPFMVAIRETPRDTRAGSPALQVMQRIFTPLRTALWLAIFASAVWLLVALASGRTAYPRWTAAVSPLPWILVFRAGARVAPPSIAGALTPAGGNLATLIFLGISLAVL